METVYSDESERHLHMTGIPAHGITNQGSRRADDWQLFWPMNAQGLPNVGAGQGWARLTGREGEGDKQPSLQQEEEGGKEKEGAKLVRARTR